MLAVWGADRQAPASWGLQAGRQRALTCMMVSIMGVAEAKFRGREADGRVQGRGKKVSLREDGRMRVEQGRPALKV